MNALFYIAAAVAVISTVLVITRLDPVHALLYFVVSLFAVAVIFYLLGAPFVAALEVIIYAGAIMVLFLFVMMLLNLGGRTAAQERTWLSPGIWIGPVILALILMGELVYALLTGHPSDPRAEGGVIPPREVSLSLFGPYVIGVEIVGVLLLAGLVGAFHLGRRDRSGRREDRDYREGSRPPGAPPPGTRPPEAPARDLPEGGAR
jgi:NADH-quinone oxidoreductase subunit J